MESTLVGRGGARNGSGRPPAISGDAVKRLRAAEHLTQEELAARIGCTMAAVRKMERENRLPAKAPVFRAFKRLCDKAGVSLETEVTQ